MLEELPEHDRLSQSYLVDTIPILSLNPIPNTGLNDSGSLNHCGCKLDTPDASLNVTGPNEHSHSATSGISNFESGAIILEDKRGTYRKPK